MARDLKLGLVIQAIDKATKPLRRISRAVDRVGKRTGLDRVGRQLRNVGRGMRSTAGEAGKFALKVGAGIAAGTGAIFGLTTRFARAGDNIAKTGRKLGLGAEELQKLRYAAELAGIPVAHVRYGEAAIYTAGGGSRSRYRRGQRCPCVSRH